MMSGAYTDSAATRSSTSNSRCSVILSPVLKVFSGIHLCAHDATPGSNAGESSAVNDKESQLNFQATVAQLLALVNCSLPMRCLFPARC